MNTFNADLHLHGPRSIGVSKAMDLPHMVHGAGQKGLQIIATGDCFQPGWRNYLEHTLEVQAGGFSFKQVFFILQAEVEDAASVHHVLLFPRFDVVDEIKRIFGKHSTNIDHEWGGRPRVNLSPGEIVETCTEHGALVGPAHAFTPFKSLFRQGKFDTLSRAYGAQAKNVHFLELGLSANTNLADRIKELHRLTFLSNSDAHAPGPQSLGREFNTFDMDAPTFEELDLAIRRVDGRRVTRNVGFDPRLGKYHVLFCKACRRRVLPFQGDQVSWDDEFIHLPVSPGGGREVLLQDINASKVNCPACREAGKTSKIKLGVSERVEILADTPPGFSPSHRPPYIDIVPLIEMIRVAAHVGSATSKRVARVYDAIIACCGSEIGVLLGVNLDKMVLAPGTADPAVLASIKAIITSFRQGQIEFKPGGGGTFGELAFEA